MPKEKGRNKGFLIIQGCFLLLITIIVLMLYFFAFQSAFEDPIKSMKKNILKTQLVMIGISLITTLLATIFTRNKKRLVQEFIIIAVITIIMIITQSGIKLYVDNKYNEEAFVQFYEQFNPDDGNKKGITFGWNGIGIGDEKESYVQQSKISYNIFKLKTMAYIMIHVIILIILIYVSIRLMAIEERKSQVQKDDIIWGDKTIDKN